jgi:hypothetical protein
MPEHAPENAASRHRAFERTMIAAFIPRLVLVAGTGSAVSLLACIVVDRRPIRACSGRAAGLCRADRARGSGMLLVSVFLDRSPIQGIGVFARQAIPAGARVWELDLRFDRLVEISVYEGLMGPARDYLDRYAYPRRSDPRFIVFEADDARYMNHAADPNCGFLSEDVAVALRDIAPGEELTCDYNTFFENGFEFLGDR